MKKYYAALLLLAATILLASWGGTGHKTVATIAYNHLSPEAKKAVASLLGDSTMADVASWADEMRMKPEFKYTTPRHYVDLPMGLPYKIFRDTVTLQPADNVYKAVLQCEKDLSSPATTRRQKTDALKYLIHFIGDLHQPMHVSRAEDQGGNTIQVHYEGKDTNLHSLWDSRLISTEGKSFEQMSVDYDRATQEQIRQWQSDPLMQWLWESYKITEKLYAEVEASSQLNEAYYKEHISIVHERIQMGGIRLAGILNQIFSKPPVSAAETTRPVPIVKELPGSQAVAGVKLEDVSKHIGGRVAVQGIVADHKKLDNLVLVNLGAAYPDQLLTLVFKGQSMPLSEKVVAMKGKKILVTGTVTEFKGKARIEVNTETQIYAAP